MPRNKALLYISGARRSLLKLLRKKREHYKALNEGAAIDIASIMIAVFVLSLIGSLIAATTFIVIPWAQDEAAKNQLKSVMAAQQAYVGMAATENLSGQPIGSIYALKLNSSRSATTSDARYYGDLTDLIESGLFDPAFLPEDAEDEIYGEQMLSRDKFLCVVKVESGGGYETAILSQSGNMFAATETHNTPVKIPETEAVCKGRVLGEYGDSEDKVIIPPTSGTLDGQTPTPTPTPTPEEGGVGGVTENAPVTPEQAPEPPAANKDPKTKEFMFCHHGAMHTNNFNGMINGHHGHAEDIMPPIPFKNYVGWNWNAETAKIYYNNCVPV